MTEIDHSNNNNDNKTNNNLTSLIPLDIFYTMLERKTDFSFHYIRWKYLRQRFLCRFLPGFSE